MSAKRRELSKDAPQWLPVACEQPRPIEYQLPEKWEPAL
jgi:hypothetical protein